MYNVSVIASNHISSLSVAISFYVQVKPFGLHLVKDPEPYHTQLGYPVSFIANISNGTDVSYGWSMGDGQVYSPAGIFNYSISTVDNNLQPFKNCLCSYACADL